MPGLRRTFISVAVCLLVAMLAGHFGISCQGPVQVHAAAPSFPKANTPGQIDPRGADIPVQPVTNAVIDTLTDEEKDWLRAHPVISVFQDPGWPPVEFTDTDGRNLGITADYLALMERRLPIRFKQVRGLSWQEGFARMRRGQIDMTTSVAVTPERSSFWAFTNPYMTIPIVIVTPADVTYVGSMRELHGKKVAVVDGYAVTEWMTRDHPDIHLVKVTTSTRGLELLQQGKVFAFIENMLVVGYYLSKMKIANLKIAGETPYVNSQCMAVRKDWPILARILQKALDSIGEAERAAIYQRWVPIRYEHGFDYRLLWQALAVFTAVVLALVVWNQKLAKEIRSRKAAEANLEASEERLRLALDGATDGIWDWDLKSGRMYFSPRCHDMLGYPDNDYPASYDRWKGLLHPDDLAQAQTAFRQAIRSQMPFAFEFRMKNKSGRWRWILARGKVAERDGHGNALRMAGSQTDVTERKDLEAQFLQAQKMESVGRLAGGVAHDFNNMLAVIVGNTELALEMVEPDQPLRNYLEEIEKAGRRSTELTRQLLAFARKQTIVPRVMDLNDTVAAMLKLVRRLVGEDIHLAWIPGANLWPVKIDPAQLDQILANLCVNARDAITGVGKVTIETRNITAGRAYGTGNVTVVPGDYVKVAVSDDGIGMNKEVLDHLFEPFFTTKAVGRGTGLGLATVYGIVQQNDGFVTVASQPGQGTTFNIHLPRYTGTLSDENLLPPEEIPLGNGQTVLLVEDETEVLNLGLKVLERLGYTVLGANTPTAALALAKAHRGQISLLVTDVVMPEMNGRDLYERIASLNPEIKCLYMSGYTADVIARRGVLDPGVRFIQKPFSKHEMAIKVSEALSNRE